MFYLSTLNPHQVQGQTDPRLSDGRGGQHIERLQVNCRKNTIRNLRDNLWEEHVGITGLMRELILKATRVPLMRVTVSACVWVEEGQVSCSSWAFALTVMAAWDTRWN